MKTLLVGFGDSWTFGSELDRPQQQSWVAQLASMLGAEHINFGTPASSPGHLMVQLFDFIKKDYNRDEYKIIFMVGISGSTRYLSYSNRLEEFINITPEAVYRTGDILPTGQPPDVVDNTYELFKQTYQMVEHPAYNQFLIAQTIFAFQQYSLYNEIDCLFFSYFDPIDVSLYQSALYDHTVYSTTITQALTGQEYSIPEIRSNEYFEGKLFHPNIKGHARIAQLLKEFYDKEYPRN